MMNGRPTKTPEGRGPFRRLRQWIARLTGSKAFLGAVSLLCAVLAWSIMVASDGTLTREKVFQSVAVSVNNEAALKSRGYIVMDDILELVPSVKMTVEVTQANYNRVSGTVFNPHFDLTQIEGEGENVLQISYSTSQLYGTVLSCEPSSVTVQVERYVTRRVPVVVEVAGEIPEGLYLDSYRSDPTTLSVSGPQSLVSSVSRAVARLDQSALSAERMSDRAALAIELQDAQGNVLESDKLEVTNQSVITQEVTVETELVPMKEVSLDSASFVTGEPAEGYVLTGVELAVESVEVAAQQDTLDSITLITTDAPLDIEGATGDVSGYVRLKRPTAIENTLPTEVAVTAHIEEETVERTFRQVSIEVDGLDETLAATLSRTRATVQLTGAYGFINGLETGDIRLFVDLSGLEPGEHEVPVQIHIDNAQPFTCALSSPEITVTLREK